MQYHYYVSITIEEKANGYQAVIEWSTADHEILPRFYALPALALQAAKRYIYTELHGG